MVRAIGVHLGSYAPLDYRMYKIASSRFRRILSTRLIKHRIPENFLGFGARRTASPKTPLWQK